MLVAFLLGFASVYALAFVVDIIRRADGGWRRGYDQGYADAAAGRPPNPSKPSVSG